MFAGWSETTLLRLTQRVGAALFAAVVATAQARRFRVFSGNDGEPGKLLLPGLLAVFGLGTLGNMISFGVMQWAS
jgi:hypothetical protein